MSALYPLLLAVGGFPVVVGVPLAIARWSAHQHAEQTAAAIRKTTACRAIERQKELTR